ncbi:hypothetical protein FPV67DRAFT_1666070 [Lyophyllum atratum]|nr:hypothetical protein FPV67DRAFT_1666070 [Lyophyllum atratum]
MPSTFPQEIVDKIIQEIDGPTRSKKHAFQSCSLVSQSFRDPAQKHLFRYLLVDPAIASQYTSICEILHASPRMCRFVESICFIIDTDTLSESTPPGLPDLPRLHHVTVTGGRHLGWRDNWAYIPEAVKSDLCDIIRRPTVAVLSIYMISGFPIGVVCSCSQLTMLDVWDVLFATGSHNPPPSYSSTPLPVSWRTTNSPNGSTPLAVNSHTSKPLSPTPNVRVTDAPSTTSSHQLTLLRRRDSAVAKGLNLPNLRTLRSLFKSNHLQGGITIHLVGVVLLRLPNINNLVEFTITTDVGTLMSDRRYPAVWARIDRHLTEDWPPGAKRTTVIITLSMADSYPIEAIRELFNKMFPRLVERGQLKVELHWPTRVPSFVTIMPLV